MKTTLPHWGCMSLLTCILFHCPFVFSQLCSSGCLYVSGNNCGCWQNCDLSSINGPTCGSGTLGNCDDGHQFVSARIFVPDGCSITANISMANRPGCPHSAADGGPSPCTNCDQIRVYALANSGKGFKSGFNNADLHDSETLTGPDSVIIEGYANRADEVISYSLSYSSGVCDGSCAILPISLLDFTVAEHENALLLAWTTGFENNLSHFALHASIDGVYYEPLASISPVNLGTSIQHYEHLLYAPSKWQYFQLLAFDQNYQLSYTKTIPYHPPKGGSTLNLSTQDNVLVLRSQLNYELLEVYATNGKLVYKASWTRNGVEIPSWIEGTFLFVAKGMGQQEQTVFHLSP